MDTAKVIKGPQTVGNPHDLTEKDDVWIYDGCFNTTPKTSMIFHNKTALL